VQDAIHGTMPPLTRQSPWWLGTRAHHPQRPHEVDAPSAVTASRDCVPSVGSSLRLGKGSGGLSGMSRDLAATMIVLRSAMSLTASLRLRPSHPPYIWPRPQAHLGHSMLGTCHLTLTWPTALHQPKGSRLFTSPFPHPVLSSTLSSHAQPPPPLPWWTAADLLSGATLCQTR